MEETKHIVILAAGDFPTRREPLEALRGADVLVCCDSAYLTLLAAAPDQAAQAMVVGDGDSLPEADRRHLGECYVQVVEQDFNDLHKAMSWAVQHHGLHHTRYTVVGATGRREDHTLGNISYLVTFLEEYPALRLEMLTDYGRITAFTGRRTFPSFPRQQVSIFSLTPDFPIDGTGLQWPLDGFHARRWWNATLNSALGDSITLASEGWLIVFQTYDAKE